MAHQKVTKAYSANTGTANTFSYSGDFDVFKASEVVVSLDAVDLTYTTSTINESASPREYTVDTAAKTIHIGGANLSSGTIIIRPVTDMGDPTARAVFSPGSSITAADLNNNQTQLLRKAMEYDDISIKNSGGTMVGHLTMGEDTTIIFEGATDDAYETTLTVVDPTADRTISLPNESGTLLTTGGAGTVAVGNMGANSVDSDQYVDGSIDTVHIQDANVTLDKIEPLASGKIILGNGSNRPAPVTLSGDVTVSNSGVTTIGANTVEIGMLDCEQTSGNLTSSDSHIPTSAAVATYVQSKIDPIGGLEVIETKDHFPETQPAVGVIISIENAGGIVISSNSSTTPDTISSDTQVTINQFPNDITGTIADRVGLMVTSTGSGHIYNYHKALLKEADLVNLSSDIEDFGNRYRTGSSRTSDNDSSNDDGDLFFDQGANTMYVYDGAYNSGGAWKEVTSAGDFKILTAKDHDQASGGSGPTFNGSNEEFDLFDGSADASINSAAQLLVVLNGVVQKPNSGSFDGSAEGFYLNDTHGIKFCDPPASGSTLFVTQIGTATTLGVPANDSVTAAKTDISLVAGDIIYGNGTDSWTRLAKPSSNKFLRNTSGGTLSWETVDSTPEGEVVKSTTNGNEAATKFLRADGDGTCSWQIPPDTQPLTTEQVEDIVGGMLDGDESGITVTYDDNDGNIDFTVGTLNQDTTGTADHVKITDNESTNENNLIPFVEDAQGAGNRGLESDGDFHYNPSTGTVTATAFAGNGANLTGVSSSSADGCIWKNSLTISNNHTIAANEGAHSVGPITNNATVTVNGRWVIS